MTREQWREQGRRLGRSASRTSWRIGDWLLLGERQFGSTYTEAKRLTGLSEQTLKNICYVVRRYTPGERFPKLLFSLHAEVASLPDRKEWLMRAATQGWTRDELRGRARPRGRLDGKAISVWLPMANYKAVKALCARGETMSATGATLIELALESLGRSRRTA